MYQLGTGGCSFLVKNSRMSTEGRACTRHLLKASYYIGLISKVGQHTWNKLKNPLVSTAIVTIIITQIQRAPFFTYVATEVKKCYVLK